MCVRARTAMACTTGVHCVTGPGAFAFTDEEPPLSLSWFVGAFVAVLYTRSALGTLAFFFMFHTVVEFVHLMQAWLTTDEDGGPLDPNPSPVLGLFFGRHPVADSLLITYPLFAVAGAWFGHVVVRAMDTPVYLQSYFGTSARARKTGRWIWLLRQVKYSTQLTLVAYFPSTMAFGVTASVLGTHRRVEILVVWIVTSLSLVLLYWWWNSEELSVVWTAARGTPAHVRHTRFYMVWAATCILVWTPVIALSGTSIASQFRVAIGIGGAFGVLLVLLLLCRGKTRTETALK